MFPDNQRSRWEIATCRSYSSHCQPWWRKRWCAAASRVTWKLLNCFSQRTEYAPDKWRGDV